ncbi:hypothetical protein SAMN06297468_2607 [Altererythrobacter xiamenensis]|uniref:Peptidase inhibitor I78 family protein n=1 Tax=Altererythrobacter xiamenensis TaxID=1316679 RepID=A0A1Y6FJ16_9SPHN|nr:hypothetical protein [Altererythrobacter xiamenensis]SMQ74376.1 hypothetical protein SAMN06297468_2607 [Altererythrobacter xiamenensis]
MKHSFLPIPLALAAALSACGDAREAEEAEPIPADEAEFGDYSRDTPDLPDPDLESDKCNSRLAAPYIGQELDADTRGELMTAVAPIVTVRWIGPGEATTDDLNPQRLNVMYGADNVITSVGCG